MKINEAIQKRIKELCNERKITPNALSYICGVSQSTIYSILGDKTKNPEASTVKKICDGLDMTLAEFFSTPVFDALEQEIE